MPRVLMFANPTSGRGRGVGVINSLSPVLVAAGYATDVWLQPPPDFDDAATLRSAEAIVVVGGDGTLRAVIDRLLLLIGNADLPPVLFIGLGTANVMQRHLGLIYPKAGVARRALELLTARAVRPVDIGTVADLAVDTSGHTAGDLAGGGAAGRVFLLMTSVGYDAGVVHALAANRRGPITKLSYVAPAVRHFFDQMYNGVTVTVDGRVVHAGGPAQVFVGNVAEYGTGVPILRQADSADGVLDVCVLPCANHLDFAKMVWLLARGGQERAAGVTYVRGRDVRIDAASPMPVQIDGDPAGQTPVRLGLLPKRVDFIVP